MDMDNKYSHYDFYKIASVDEFPQGERLFVEIENQPIVIFSIGSEFVATGDICTHDGGSIGEGDQINDEIACPRHGARFNIKTGKALSFPAVVDIPVYPVRITDGFIEVGIQQDEKTS